MKKINNFIKQRENNLREIFQTKMNKLSFRELIDNLDIKQDKLYKHTSSLDNSSMEFENCMTCKGLNYCKNELNGYCNLPEVDGDDITFTYKACKYKKRELEKNKYKQNLNLFDMPKTLKEAKIKDIYTDDVSRADAIKYILNFLKNYKKDDSIKGMYLHGNFGCGKTYLIATLFNELAKKGEKSAIIYFPEFLRSLKVSMLSREQEEISFGDKYEYVKRIPFLLIDDLGAENVTSWGRDEILGTLLQYRMTEELPTFFTSNLTIEELESHLAISSKKEEKVKARRIIERIKSLTVDIEIIGKSRRE